MNETLDVIELLTGTHVIFQDDAENHNFVLGAPADLTITDNNGNIPANLARSNNLIELANRIENIMAATHTLRERARGERKSEQEQLSP